MMYDADKVNDSSTKATLEFQIDMQISTAENRMGKVMDILDYKQYNWPGHGMPDDGEAQFIEGEYLRENEYDVFMRDPTDFWYRDGVCPVRCASERFRRMELCQRYLFRALRQGHTYHRNVYGNTSAVVWSSDDNLHRSQ